VDLEFFAFHGDPPATPPAKLIAKAKSGVRSTSDRLPELSQEQRGSWTDGRRQVNVRAFTDGYKHPITVNSITDHRKVALVDDKLAISGGIVGSPTKYWHDLMFKVRDGAGLLRLLPGELEEVNGSPLSRSPSTPVRGGQAAGNRHHPSDQEIARARSPPTAPPESSISRSPYFIDDEVVEALCAAAQRGVDVHVIIPGKGDNPFVDVMNADVRKYFTAAGIKVHQYDTKNPDIEGHDHAKDRFNHGKVAVVDGQYVMIGTANADNRSMAVSREINLHVDSPEFAREVTERVFTTDFQTRARIRTEDGSFLYPMVNRFPFLSKVRELF
jgi:phosphatidylserine/phosphatidylglycerophosphate/cardiolipin synthase-like enzyme